MTLAEILEALLADTKSMSILISRREEVRIAASDNYGEIIDGHGKTMEDALKSFTQNAETWALERVV